MTKLKGLFYGGNYIKYFETDVIKMILTKDKFLSDVMIEGFNSILLERRSKIIESIINE